MCGIIGYVGQKSASSVLLEGLKKLEYRGYDSAGLAILKKDTSIITIKTVGRVKDLKEKMADFSLSGNTGIAHTRWATHGQPTEANAHPHSDCKNQIWLVHNGIIENYQSLKNVLIKEGHQFKSETDTEVLAHLIEKYYQGNLEEAVQNALTSVQGTYGIAVFSKLEPDKIVAAKSGSPLLIGLGQKENLVASDATAVLNYTRQVVYLDEGEIAVITPNQFSVATIDKPHAFLQKEQGRHLVDKKISFLEWNLTQTEKKGFPHFMLKEIFEEPEVVENSIRGRIIPKEGLAKLGGLELVSEKLRKIKKLVIVACGTAFYAGLISKYMIEEYAGLPTETELASEFRYRKSILDKEKTALLAISQSGETADTLAALREAKRKGILTLGIINVIDSSIARETEAGVYNHAGPEISVASTKAFTSQLTVLTLLTLFLGRQREMSLIMGQRIAKAIQNLPNQIRKILKQNNEIKKIAKKYAGYNNFLYLGRKYNYPVALDGALKLKEVSYIHAEGYSSGEMKHGPIALIDKNCPTIAIIPKDSVYEKNKSNLEEIKARKGKIVAIVTQGDKKISSLTDEVIYIPKTLEMLTPILSVIPLQLFAYHVGVFRNCDIDKPRNLAKSVTVE